MEGEREGKEYWCERRTSTGCLLYALQGTEPTSRLMPLPGMEQAPFFGTGTMPNQLSYAGQVMNQTVFISQYYNSESIHNDTHTPTSPTFLMFR